MVNCNESLRVALSKPPRRNTASRPSRDILPSLLAVILMTMAVPAANQQASEPQVKAAFVLNFLQFVEWPGTPAQPMTVGVLGDDAFAATLSGMPRRSAVNGTEVIVRRLTRPEEARTVHLLFIGTSEQPRLPALLRSLADAPVLTVGDTLGFAKAGVMLNLYTFDQRVRIEVNTAAAARAQLRLSAHLLRLARIVE